MISELLSRLTESEFMPHGHCYFWRPHILWLHVGSDLIIALSYYSIPIALIYFVRKRSDLLFDWMFLLFALFIFACGTTHLAEIWTTWYGTYRAEGLIKLFTAVASFATALLLWPLIPTALTIPSPAHMRKEVDERRRAEAELESAKENLERRVEESTAELSRTVEELERFNKMMVGREEQMIKLKRRINALCSELGREPEYDMSFTGAERNA